VIEVRASGMPAGLGAPVCGKLDTDQPATVMSINVREG
jgi:chorismate synthase